MLNTIEEAIQDLKKGKMIIVVDDENRENEGDLVMAAEKITPAAVNFMISKAKGLVCVPMMKPDLVRLNIPLMVEKNTDNQKTAFTISLDHKSNSTGISAFDRADTIKALADPKSRPQDFQRPGHIFPLLARDNGVLERAGHTEAAIDLMRIAGLCPAAVISEIIADNGTMARLPELEKFATQWNLKLITIKDLIEYRIEHQTTVIRQTGKIKLPTRWGNFKMIAYTSIDAKEPHLVLLKGNPTESPEPVLCRIHSECFTGDILGSLRCDCGDQLFHALSQIEKKGEGVLIYLRQEGRGIGLLNKLKAYELQDSGMDTVQANEALGFPSEMRGFRIAADILKDLEIAKVELMTNNPLKIKELQHYGIEVERKSHEFAPGCCNEQYLQTKKLKMGHLLKKVSGNASG